MKRKLAILGLIFTLLALPLVVCTKFIPTATAAAAKPITWTFATSTGAGVNMWAFHPYPRWQKMIEEATGGRLKINTKVDLVAPTDVVFAVKDGRADVGFQRIPWVSGTFPLWDFAGIPFLFADAYEYEKALNDPRMIEIMDKTYADVGLVKLYETADPGLNTIFSNKELPTVASFKGVKIRTTGLVLTYAVELMGASPLTMPIFELADALSRGTVDAVFTATTFGLGFGLADVTKYANYWEISPPFGGMLVVNMKTWKALPADLQKIVKDVSMDMQRQVFFGIDATERMARIGVKAAKMKDIVPEKAEVAKAMALTKPAVDKWLGVAGPYGPEVLAIAGKYGSGAKIMLKK